MTDELTKTFFDTFGIEPRLDCKRCGAMNFALGQCAEVDCKKTYPTITDRILLELICIRNSLLNRQFQVWDDNLEGLRIEILNRLLIDYKSCIQSFSKIGREQGYEFKYQVQALFKEG